MKIKVLIAMFLLVACAPHTEVVDILKGEKGDRGADGQNAVPCSIEQTEGGLALSCGEQTFYLSNGTNGTSGTSCSVEPIYPIPPPLRLTTLRAGRLLLP